MGVEDVTGAIDLTHVPGLSDVDDIIQALQDVPGVSDVNDITQALQTLQA